MPGSDGPNEDCNSKARIKRFLGLQPLNDSNADYLNVIRIIFPDMFVFAGSLASYLVLRSLRTRSHTGSQEAQLIQSQTETFLASDPKTYQYDYYSKMNKGLFLLSLCFLALAGIASPSLLSLAYLLLFLLLTTLYSFHMDLEPLPQIYKLRLFISIYTAVHLVLIYIYQLQIITDEWLKPTTLPARLLGMKQLVQLNCTEPYQLKIAGLPHNTSACNELIEEIEECPCNLTDGKHCVGTEWPAFVEPVFIMFLHFFCAFTYKIFSQMEALKQRQGMLGGIHETDPMIDADDCLSSDTHHRSNISTNSPVSMAALTHRISIFAARLPPKKQITIALREKALYVCGLIVMMAWSVTYHSWITFILLLWSCYLWMARNRDKVTLRHAKYITLYAIVLILLQVGTQNLIIYYRLWTIQYKVF